MANIRKKGTAIATGLAMLVISGVSCTSAKSPIGMLRDFDHEESLEIPQGELIFYSPDPNLKYLLIREGNQLAIYPDEDLSQQKTDLTTGDIKIKGMRYILSKTNRTTIEIDPEEYREIKSHWKNTIELKTTLGETLYFPVDKISGIREFIPIIDNPRIDRKETLLKIFRRDGLQLEEIYEKDPKTHKKVLKSVRLTNEINPIITGAYESEIAKEEYTPIFMTP